ncbi:unnamed protein product, partial [Oppiella nova]
MQDSVLALGTKKLSLYRSLSPSITTDQGYYTLVPSQLLPTCSRNTITNTNTMREELRSFGVKPSIPSIPSIRNKQKLNTKTNCLLLSGIQKMVLSDVGFNLSLPIQRIVVNACDKLTDKSLIMIARKCASKLTSIEIRSCTQTYFGIAKILSKCVNIERIDITGSMNVSLNGVQQPEHLPKLLNESLPSEMYFTIRPINQKGCETVSDAGVVVLARSCGPRLKAIDLGKCQITDKEKCPNLRKISVKECASVSDTGIMAIAYNCRQLILLNITNCDHITIESYLGLVWDTRYIMLVTVDMIDTLFLCNQQMFTKNS